MKFSDIFWTMALVRLASRPSPPDNGKDDNSAGCSCLIAIVIALALIFGMFA
jgi:hypothetical protein